MQDYTEIIMVLDRSGSMSSIWGSTIESMNAFIAEQQKLEGKCNFTLNQFDTEHLKTYDAQPIKEIPFLTNKTYVPRGMTALYDAIGMAIQETGKRLAAMPEHARPKSVMFAIMTDGDENASREFSQSSINDLISHQTEKYSWDFVFLGANQDAISTGASLGFSADKSMTFNASDLGMSNSMTALNAYYSNVRSGGASLRSASFSEEDRTNALK